MTDQTHQSNTDYRGMLLEFIGALRDGMPLLPSVQNKIRDVTDRLYEAEGFRKVSASMLYSIFIELKPEKTIEMYDMREQRILGIAHSRGILYTVRYEGQERHFNVSSMDNFYVREQTIPEDTGQPSVQPTRKNPVSKSKGG